MESNSNSEGGSIEEQCQDSSLERIESATEGGDVSPGNAADNDSQSRIDEMDDDDEVSAEIEAREEVIVEETAVNEEEVFAGGMNTGQSFGEGMPQRSSERMQRMQEQQMSYHQNQMTFQNDKLPEQIMLSGNQHAEME